MSHDHLTLEELHLCLDGRLSSAQKERVEEHMHICPDCRRSVEEARRIESTVRAMPLETTSPAFTSFILAKLGRRQHGSASYRIAMTLAPLIGVLFVLGVITGALVLFGTDESMTDQASRPAFFETLNQGSRYATGILGQGIDIVHRLFPFLRETSSGMISLLVIVSFAVLMAADRLVFRRLLQRL